MKIKTQLAERYLEQEEVTDGEWDAYSFQTVKDAFEAGWSAALNTIVENVVFDHTEEESKDVRKLLSLIQKEILSLDEEISDIFI